MAAAASRDQIIDRLHQLPSIPVVVQEVIASFRDASVDGAALARKISQDQGMSARMLRIANSSFYGLPREVRSIQEALIVLGFNNMRSLALSMGFVQAFPAASGSGFDRNSYWRRSLGVAGFSGALAQCFGQDAQVAFTCGMFHEIGQLVLDVCMPEQWARMLKQQKASGRSLAEIERENLGCDHAWLGAEVLRYWNFPAEIEHVARHWQTLGQDSSEPITDIVHVGALLDSGLRGDALISCLPGALCRRMRISWGRIEAGMPDMERLAAEAGAILAM